MTLRFFATWRFENIGSAQMNFTDGTGTYAIEIDSGRHSHIGLTEVVGENSATKNVAAKFADVLETAMNGASGATYTVTFNETTLAYTIAIAASTFTINTTNAVMRNIVGLTNSAHSAQASFSSDVRPYYLIDALQGGRSSVSDDFERGDIAYDAESDDGESYGSGRVYAPRYDEFLVTMEPKYATFRRLGFGAHPITLTSTITNGVSSSFTIDGATPLPVGANIYNVSATNIFSGFTVSAVTGSDSDASAVAMTGVASTGAASSATLLAGFSTVGWTYQHLFEHCRTVEFFSMHDGRERKLLKFVAEGAVFSPERVVADYDDQWNVPFKVRVVGRY